MLIPCAVQEMRLAALTPRDCPCLAVRDDGAFLAIARVRDGLILPVGDTADDAAAWRTPPGGRFTVHVVTRPSSRSPGPGGGQDVMADFRQSLPGLLLASFAINASGFATPLFVIAVYDTAIPSTEAGVIASLVLGIATVFLFELLVRSIRGSAVVSLAARLEYRLGLTLLKKLMALPVSTLVRSDADQHLVRLRQFEAVREVMVGPIARFILDVPFAVLFAAMLFALAPSVGIVVVATAVAHLLVFALFAPVLQGAKRSASEAEGAYRADVAEVVSRRQAIRHLGLCEYRRTRLSDKFDLATGESLRSAFLATCAATVGQTILALGGIVAAVTAFRMAIAGQVTMGALIALIIVVWRFLLPLQTLLTSGVQIMATMANLRRSKELLSLPEEDYRGARPRTMQRPRGTIVFEQVVVRFPRAESPALAGVSFRAEPGEIVSISGRAMAGKTVLSETLAGIHAPVAGRVLVDGVDIRHMPVDDLRMAFAVAPQRPEFLYGTIAQNLELALPGVDRAAMRTVLRDLGIDDLLTASRKGLDAQIDAEWLADTPLALQQLLSVARALLRPGPVFVFDQPTAGLDAETARRVRDAVCRCKDRGIVLLITNDPRDLEIADRCMVMDQGRVLLNERRQTGLRKVLAILRLDSEKAAA